MRLQMNYAGSRRGQFARFVGVGLLNTGVGYSLFALLIWLGLDSGSALLVATVIGVLFNFLTTGRLVFGNGDIRLLIRFGFAYGVVYFINVALLRFLASFGFPAISSQAGCLLITVPISFVLQKLFVFKEIAHEDH